jgi:hypothetical protein
MSVNEVTLWSAAICGVLAYPLPLALWIKDRSAFRSLLLTIPVLVIGSWRSRRSWMFPTREQLASLSTVHSLRLWSQIFSY